MKGVYVLTMILLASLLFYIRQVMAASARCFFALYDSYEAMNLTLHVRIHNGGDLRHYKLIIGFL